VSKTKWPEAKLNANVWRFLMKYVPSSYNNLPWENFTDKINKELVLPYKQLMKRKYAMKKTDTWIMLHSKKEKINRYSKWFHHNKNWCTRKKDGRNTNAFVASVYTNRTSTLE
jgi:hypothetical protein